MNNKEVIIDSTALVTAVAAAAGAAAGAVALARGETMGAPGITKGLARLGRSVGGSMLTGIALVGACSAIIAVATFQSLRQIDL